MQVELEHILPILGTLGGALGGAFLGGQRVAKVETTLSTTEKELAAAKAQIQVLEAERITRAEERGALMTRLANVENNAPQFKSDLNQLETRVVGRLIEFKNEMVAHFDSSVKTMKEVSGLHRASDYDEARGVSPRNRGG